MKLAFVSALLATLLGTCLARPAEAGDPAVPSALDLARRLGDPDSAVAEAAVAALVAQGDRAIEVLTPLAAFHRNAAGGSPGHFDEAAPRAAAGAARALAGIGMSKRLAGAAKDSLAFWMSLEDVLDREAGPVRDSILESALGGSHLAGKAIERRNAASAVAAEFCRDWSFAGDVPRDADAQKRLKERLVAVGSAAAPYLLRVVGRNPVAAGQLPFGHPFQTMAAERAVEGLAILKVREAVPFFLFQATGPSAMLDGVAQKGVDDLAGTRFATPESGVWGRVFGLQPETAPMVAWWREHRAEYREGIYYLMVAALAEARADLARLVATGAKPEGLAYDDGGFVAFEDMMAKRLALVVGEDLPLHFSGDAAARLAAVRAAEAWAESRLRPPDGAVK